MTISARQTDVLLAALAAVLAGVCHAQEFSAEVIYTTGPKVPQSATAKSASAATTTARIYVSKERVRLESSGVIEQTMIVDEATKTSLVLYPDRKSYASLGPRPSLYFRVPDAEHACPSWQKAIGHEITCIKAAKEMVGGRDAVKYENAGKSGLGAGDAIWVDPELGYVVKWRAGDTVAELKNIKPGPQSAALFEIPAGYQPIKPGQTQK